jgi:hypothetical protein
MIVVRPRFFQEGMASSGRAFCYNIRSARQPEERVVELAVVIEPLPDRSGYTAHLAAPLQLSATAATAEEAHRQLAALLQRRLEEGLEFRALTVPFAPGGGAGGGWLPDDELTRDWIRLVQQYRAECDAADRARLEGPPDPEATSS